MDKILTISVAAYNVSKYLDKLCDSVIRSGYLDDIELLIVDDGSKDDTADIAKRFEAMYPESIRYVKKENGGHGSTINKGIELATGKYFKVLDGDDWMDSKGLMQVLTEMKHLNCDLVVTNRKRVFENTGKEQVDRLEGITSGQVFQIEDVCTEMGRLLFHSVFVKTSILKQQHIHIDENHFYVDNEILWYPFPYTETIIYFDTVVYCYRLGLADQSVNVGVVAKRINQHEFVNKQVLEFYRKWCGKMTPNKKIYFDKVIADNIAWHYEALLLLPFSVANYRRVIEYGKYVRQVAPKAAECITYKAAKMVFQNAILFYPIAWLQKGKIRRGA